MSKLIRKAKGRNGAIAFAIAIAIAAKFIPALLAVHDTGAFELDGNATSSVSDDWDKVCHKVMGTDCSTSSDSSSNATATSFTAEPSPNATIFTSGGSKDPQNIDQ